MKLLAIALVSMIALLQYPLWLGKGSWLRVWEINQQLISQRETNKEWTVRNAGLDAEVRDLKQGYDAIEEIARSELGMIKQGEIFFQVVDNNEDNVDPSGKGTVAISKKNKKGIGGADLISPVIGLSFSALLYEDYQFDLNRFLLIRQPDLSLLDGAI